jgi:hypothetical protein
MQGGTLTMCLHRLFLWIRTKHRGPVQNQEELGIVISKRLRELLPENSNELVETTSTESNTKDENNSAKPAESDQSTQSSRRNAA